MIPERPFCKPALPCLAFPFLFVFECLISCASASASLPYVSALRSHPLSFLHNSGSACCESEWRYGDVSWTCRSRDARKQIKSFNLHVA
ncbi:hypothetical protein N431DRAFT_39816 [Stipitochalara longipes BDJ]|nr:hypothetical protein N431DRAFT_39816 [Stipitochalara longipes BDJ]